MQYISCNGYIRGLIKCFNVSDSNNELIGEKYDEEGSA